MNTVETILRTTTFRKIDVGHVLDNTKSSYYRFDPELGYVPDDIVIRDGVDNSFCTYSYELTGERRIVNYSDRESRISTYGDSFTMCQQVSDDETWQERLAARIGEPIRNFGCGGYGVYQAYRRALRMEATSPSSEYIILGVFDDDHIRNLDAARWIRSGWSKSPSLRPDEFYPLHGMPWAHLRFDLDKKGFVEKPGLCKTEKDLWSLCDPNVFYGTYKDDQISRLFALELGGEVENVDDLQAIAESFDLKINLRDPKKCKNDAKKFRSAYGLKSTEYLLDKMCPWLENRGKKLLVVLFYRASNVQKFLESRHRPDQQFLIYLQKKRIPYVDILHKHLADFESCNLPENEYLRRFYTGAAGAAVFGHYNPTGNFFVSTNMRKEVVDWLDPKPPAYVQ